MKMINYTINLKLNNIKNNEVDRGIFFESFVFIVQLLSSMCLESEQHISKCVNLEASY